MIFKVLSYIGEKLNENGITWGVGASIVLNGFGMIDKPNDIDIFVDIKDIDRTDAILKSIGEKKKWERNTTYSTKYFYEYIVDGIDVDVMAGFAINHNCGVFEYIFDQSSISELKKINGVEIPFTSLEDWYVLYQLIPSREAKVKMIENYLVSKGMKNPTLVERSLKGNLPVEVRERVTRILGL